MQYYHAHKVIPERCRGHMACMRCCPTQAIRIRNGRASILEELCVDCGACIAACRSGAIVPITDPMADISLFKYTVVVPSSVLYAQFDPSIHPYVIHRALKGIGFDEVVDTGESCAMVAKAYVRYLRMHRGRLPLISSECPAMLRLIQVRYPDLVELIAPLDVPREITARELRKNLPAKLGIKPEHIGIFYVSPCPAKIVSIRQPAEKSRSWFDGAISMKDTYAALFPRVIAEMKTFDESQVPADYTFNGGWATLGGITRVAEMDSWLAVSGWDHVMRIMDDIENSRLRNVDLVEALACMLGCIGGNFNVENPYVTRANSIKQRARYERPMEFDDREIDRKLEAGYFFMENLLLPRPTAYFDTDLETSIKRMKEREIVYRKLPQIDCGCCGAPSCMSFAEDFVRGDAKLTDCILFTQKSGEG